MSKRNNVTSKMDPTNPAALSSEQKGELNALAARTDAEIDVTEIPPLTEAFWKQAVRNPFYKPMKTQLTVRVDTDVLAWLRAAGGGYQTKLNTILRQAMLRDLTGRS